MHFFAFFLDKECQRGTTPSFVVYIRGCGWKGMPRYSDVKDGREIVAA